MRRGERRACEGSSREGRRLEGVQQVMGTWAGKRKLYAFLLPFVLYENSPGIDI